MKYKLIVFFASILISIILNAQDTVRIYGMVTDFNSKPIDSVYVDVKDCDFKTLFETMTDHNGCFSMKVVKGVYYCMYAIKLSDYGKTKLEYWAWNVPAYGDLEINPQYEKMELYGLNAFEPQVGPYETYMVYFRPMSLTKSLQYADESNKKEFERKSNDSHDTINIAPTSISKEELKVSVNNVPTDVVSINKVVEYARGAYIYGYLIQILKPKNMNQIVNDFDKISLILHSKETDEYGKGECFINKVK